ncbi:MAG: hypothetical protein LBD03_09815 [Methanobrevibacter sp.]|jgi:chromosome segregation ATPase|nr:hypothetical protein [Candidatus Methanovirga procula]
MIKKEMTAIKKGGGVGYNLYINNKDITDLNMMNKHDNINHDNIKNHEQDLTVIINNPDEYQSLQDQHNNITTKYNILQDNYNNLQLETKQYKKTINQLNNTIDNLNSEIIDLKETNEISTNKINDYYSKNIQLKTLTNTNNETIIKLNEDLQDLQKKNDLHIHLITTLYERLKDISSFGLIDRIKNKGKNKAEETIETIKPKIIELIE